MTSSVLVRVAMAAATLAACTAAGATMLAGPAGRATAQPSPAVPASAPSATDLALIGGTVTAVDAKAGTLTVSGRALPWDASRLKVFGPGGRASTIDQVRPGAVVRFALEPGNAAQRRIVLVYVDRRP
jgi:hypothetical protein